MKWNRLTWTYLLNVWFKEAKLKTLLQFHLANLPQLNEILAGSPNHVKALRNLRCCRLHVHVSQCYGSCQIRKTNNLLLSIVHNAHYFLNSQVTSRQQLEHVVLGILTESLIFFHSNIFLKKAHSKIHIYLNSNDWKSDISRYAVVLFLNIA